MRTSLITLAMASAAMVGCTKEKMSPIVYEADVNCEDCTQRVAAYRGDVIAAPSRVVVLKEEFGIEQHSMHVGTKFAGARVRENGFWRHGVPKGYVGGIASDFDRDGSIDSLTIDDPTGGRGQWVYRSSTYREGMGGGGGGGFYTMSPELKDLQKRKVVRGKCWGYTGYGMSPHDECGDDLFFVMPPALELHLNKAYARGRR